MSLACCFVYLRPFRLIDYKMSATSFQRISGSPIRAKYPTNFEFYKLLSTPTINNLQAQILQG